MSTSVPIESKTAPQPLLIGVEAFAAAGEGEHEQEREQEGAHRADPSVIAGRLNSGDA